ncbi:bZIP transcription factor [Rhizoctonia solani]|uniref:BZIP transcription factor n=1 Tax=Rhizoctonia solani TaxID=456999 RepID=A0A8H7ICD4_9AGAM
MAGAPHGSPMSSSLTDAASDVPAVPASKRGRKRNDNLPPNRARDVQRAFRARRAAHLQDLESRVEVLETENYRLRQMLSLPPSDRQPLGRGPTGRDPGKLMPKVGDISMHQGQQGPSDHYSDRSTPSPSASHSHAGYPVPTWPPNDHYMGNEDPVSRTSSSGSSSPYPHQVNYDYGSQRLPSMAHSRDSLMMSGGGSPNFNGSSTPRDETLLGGFASGGFPSPAGGVNNHASAALPPHSHSNANLLLNPGSSRMIPGFMSAGSAPGSAYVPRRSVNDLGSSFPPRSGSMGLNGPYSSAAPGGRLGLSSPSPIN